MRYLLTYAAMILQLESTQHGISFIIYPSNLISYSRRIRNRQPRPSSCGQIQLHRLGSELHVPDPNPRVSKPTTPISYHGRARSQPFSARFVCYQGVSMWESRKRASCRIFVGIVITRVSMPPDRTPRFALNLKRAVLSMGDTATRMSNALFCVNSTPVHYSLDIPFS